MTLPPARARLLIRLTALPPAARPLTVLPLTVRALTVRALTVRALTVRALAVRAAVLALAVLPLTGCAAGGSDPVPGSTTADLPFATYERTGEGGDSALLTGTLELRDGCVVVAAEVADPEVADPVVADPVVPVLPDTARWDAVEQVVAIEGREFAIGSVVAWGGGFTTGPPAVARRPAACPQDAEYFLASGLD